MSRVDVMTIDHVACLGGGFIGGSWAALFLAAGKSVAVHDPDRATERRVRETIEEVWPVLRQLGLTESAAPTVELTFHVDARVAVDGAGFVQESISERLGPKYALYRDIEPFLGPSTIVASSASELTLGELQAGWHDPANLVLGHPFGSPHLIPLVEVIGNARTGTGVVERARAFYASVGELTVEVKREAPRDIAHRLQMAM